MAGDQTAVADLASSAGQPGAGSQSSGQQQPQQFQTPAGYRLVPERDWERDQNKLRGANQYFEAGNRLGFQKPEHFAGLEKLKARGIDPLRLDQLLAETPVNGDGQGQQKPFDVEALKKELLGDVEKKASHTMAKREWEAAEKAYMDSLPNNVKGLLGDDATDADIEIYRMAALGHRLSNPSAYEDGHPLREEFPKFGDWESTKKAISELRSKAEAQRAARIGDAANKGGGKKATQPPAGQSGGQGSAKDTEAQKPGIGKMREIMERRGIH